jgi:hypothetical protein
MWNSENFGCKNHGKRSSGLKDMALKDLEGKMACLEGSRGTCGIFVWLEALARKNRGSCEVWNFFRDFWWIFVVLGVVST